MIIFWKNLQNLIPEEIENLNKTIIIEEIENLSVTPQKATERAVHGGIFTNLENVDISSGI